MGNDFVDGGIRHDLIDQREVHGMAGFFGDDMTEKRLPDQRQVADEIEGFVAAETLCASSSVLTLHSIARFTNIGT